MNNEMQIIREVNAQAEAFYAVAEHLGQHAAYALKASHRSQLTGLENIAESAFKTTDILDYIKKQTARYSFWRQGYPRSENPDEGFGESLKNYLDRDLRTKRDTLCNGRLKIGDKTDEEKQLRRHVYLLLMRQFIRQIVIEYEYSVSQSNVNRPNTGNRRTEA
jgi:hypothetical protein